MGSRNGAEKRESDQHSEDEHPFALPTNWIWCQLGPLCTKTGSGSTPRGGRSVYKERGVLFLRSQNIHNDGLRLSDVAYIDDQTHRKMYGTALEPGDLLLNITGGSIGRCCVVPDDIGEANISQHVAIIRLAIQAMQGYVHRLVLSPYFQSFVFGEQTGAGRGGLPKNKMDRIPVAVPPLAEQRRIVAKVDELMALCDRLEAAQREREERRETLNRASLHRLNNGADAEAFRDHARFHLRHLPRLTTHPKHIRDLRQTILNLAVRGKLVPQDPNDCAAADFGVIYTSDQQDRLDMPLPIGWSWARVSDVADSRLGKMLDKAKNSGKSYPYLRNTNVHWFEFRLDELKTIKIEDSEIETFLLRDGDVLICEGGHGIGRTAVWQSNGTQMVFQKALHRVRPSNQLVSDYFAFCVFVYVHWHILEKYYTGVGIPHFTGVSLSKLVFPLPPLAEQHRIVTKVDELMKLCDQLESQLTTTQTETRRLLEAILHEALAPAQTVSHASKC